MIADGQRVPLGNADESFGVCGSGHPAHCILWSQVLIVCELDINYKPIYVMKINLFLQENILFQYTIF